MEASINQGSLVSLQRIAINLKVRFCLYLSLTSFVKLHHVYKNVLSLDLDLIKVLFGSTKTLEKHAESIHVCEEEFFIYLPKIRNNKFE